jgi:anaerobic selenocysteine-containing dehydrogenase
MANLPSACPLDCPDACSLDVTVEDGRVVGVDGSHVNPLTAGFICSKVRAFADHMYGEERIARPAIRVGEKGAGEFRPVSWEEALDLVAERIWSTKERLGSQAILPCSYGGSNGLLTQDTTDARLFNRLRTSRLVRNLCAAPSSTAAQGLYGRMPGVAYEDYAHANLIVVWGANPTVSSIHSVPPIKEARERGAALVVVDPRRTALAKKADIHVPLRPGADLAVALGLINWLFDSGAADLDFLAEHASGVDQLRERAAAWPLAKAAEVADVEPATLEAFAELYAERSPAVIRCGWGPERSRSGGSATAAILAIPAVAGKFGKRGGGYTMSQSGAWSFDNQGAANEPPPATRAFTLSQLGSALCDATDPPIGLLFVYNCNPVATVADQRRVIAGLERNDLYTIVYDQVLTDTARYADLLLPATTFLEHRELHVGYGSLRMRQAHPVVEPVDEARPNCAVFAELCERMGVARDEDPVGEQALAEAILESSEDNLRIRRALVADSQVIASCGATPIQFLDVFPNTEDGKVHLMPETLDKEAPGGLYRYEPPLPSPDEGAFPLTLISPAVSKTISSTFGQLQRARVPVTIHPTDAAARNIADGAAVRIWNDLGEVRCAARIDDETRPGVAVLPKGLWSHHTANGATANALIPEDLTDIGGGPCYHEARVQIAPL